MRLSSYVIMAVTFAVAAGACLVAASFAVTAVETGSEIGVRRALDQNRQGWAEVQADGLRVVLSGTAPTEAERFQAVSVVGGVVDAARIIDAMEVAAVAALDPPRFSAEILRNDSGISIIGLIPLSSDREALIQRMARIDGASKVADLLETADYPEPPGWEEAMGFAITALRELPRSKVSVDAGRIEITAISDSPEAKQALEAKLTRAAPPTLRMVLNIAAPRPVITPFTLRFLRDGTGARFDACSADTDAARVRILAVAHLAGLEGDARCVVGMGVPSPNWSTAVEQAIQALAQLGQGSVTFADADITLVAAEGTDEALFERVVGELETALPDVFALHAVLTPPEAVEENATEGPAEFTATLSPEGLVQLRGRVTDENLRFMADSYARAAFGSENVYMAARIVPDMPPDWAVRVLAGLEALSSLEQGVVTVAPDMLSLRGISERESTPGDLAGLFANKLGEGALYELDITYRAPPEPQTAPPDPGVCKARIDAVQETAKITFEPGSATIAADSLDTMNAIADILNECGDIPLEIQGHTDSQGREQMNQDLSQARADSVLAELRARRVLTASYTAAGYGESRPIQPNDTEAGREANRRIEFWLIQPEPVVEQPTTLEALEGAEAATQQTADPAADGAEETDNEQN